MNKTLLILSLLYFCGCNQDYIAQKEANVYEQQLRVEPIKLGEHDGIIIWKLRDSTPGGKGYIYYMTPIAPATKAEIIEY